MRPLICFTEVIVFFVFFFSVRWGLALPTALPWRPRPPRTPGSPWPPAAGSRLTSNPGTQFSAAPLPGSGSSSDRQVPEKVVERVCVCARVEEVGREKLSELRPPSAIEDSLVLLTVLYVFTWLSSLVLQSCRSCGRARRRGLCVVESDNGCGVPSSFCATYLLQVRHARQEPRFATVAAPARASRGSVE